MRPTPDSTLADPQQTIADLKRQLAESKAERDEAVAERNEVVAERDNALARETAIAEVLGLINSSPGDLKPVFDAILEKAHAVCDAATGSLQIYDGESIRAVTTRGLPDRFANLLRERRQSGRISGMRAAFLQGVPYFQISDTSDAVLTGGDPSLATGHEIAGVRTLLHVPLRKDGELLGVIASGRLEVRPFSDKEIALLQNFAAQAVIAMENARLITETREALEQQTATAEVLQVINSSPGDLAPVFDAMLEKATRLCDGINGILWTFEGKRARLAASRNMLPAAVELLRRQGEAGNHPMVQRVIAGDHLFQFDLAENEAYRSGEIAAAAAVIASGVRTIIWVGLLKEGTAVGAFVISRQEVRPFTDKQIALLQNFAAQAVIAMENARLITETREALEQQTATAEVLGVINSSPGDLAPVFDALLEKATRLCDAVFGNLWTYDGEVARFAAVHGASPEFRTALMHAGPQKPEPGNALMRLAQGEPLVHIADITAQGAYRSETRRRFAEGTGARTALWVPLRKDGALLGFFTIYRTEVRPFTDKQIALLQNFAAQAVIAMENARLITETREALEQQTATAEVLGVINSSPGDLKPVFDTILEKAHTLCGATHGALGTYDADYYFRSAAARGYPEALVERLQEGFDGLTNPVTRPLIDGARFIHIPDLADIDHPIPQAVVKIGGFHTGLFLPLRKDGRLLGHISVTRSEVRPFAEKEIQLLENFAAQAVIAIENARLITETQEALEQQTATAEVLGVINSSPGDLAPVFEAILEKAHSLCGAAFGALLAYDGKHLRGVAMHGLPEPFAEIVGQPFTMSPLAPIMRLIRGELDLVHISDMAEVLARLPDDPVPRAAVELGGIRTLLAVPLRKDDRVLGIITAYRQEVRPFSDKQVALLQNFAAQAVIAMDNARLLDEIRQRQQELRVTFDNMVDGVAMFDEALRLAAWNRNFQELLQLPDEFLAQPHGFDDYIRYLTERGEFGETDPETQINRLRARIGDHYSFERTRPDGTVIEVRHSPMPGGGLVLIFSDITERKRSEEEIRAARDAAEAAYADLKAAQANLIQAEKMASLGQLTAGIAHEIKNPLNFVNNFAALSNELLDELKETPVIATLDEQQRAEIDETLVMLSGNLEKIAEHGKRADNIVKSMLEHSRGVSGERREVDLNVLVDEALNLAYHGARAQDASFNITLERDFDPTLAPIDLAPQEMTRVFLNLIGNGFYATNKRAKANGYATYRPTLRVATHATEDGVEVRVRDNGTGIPPEIRDKLFQPFFTTKPTGEGTGLGLSISYDIVTQQHGGTITVDSQEGAYTEFTISLPRH